MTGSTGAAPGSRLTAFDSWDPEKFLLFLFCEFSPLIVGDSTEKSDDEGILTSNFQHNRIALSDTLSVCRRAGVPTTVAQVDFLQYETLIADDDPGRCVRLDFLTWPCGIGWELRLDNSYVGVEATAPTRLRPPQQCMPGSVGFFSARKRRTHPENAIRFR